MVGAAVALLAAVGVYRAYGLYAHAQLDDLNYVATDVLATAAAPGGAAPTPSPPLQGRPTPAAPTTPATAPASEGGDGAPRFAIPDSVFARVYPGSAMHPKYWDRPLWAGADPYLRIALPEGFQPLSAQSDSRPRGALPGARRIIIPSIGVDAAVRDLQVLDMGSSKAWETPDNIVGHIPGTANPGEQGLGWFFGHLESPLQREGNVFRNLPRVPRLLKDGDPVFVQLVGDAEEYLYQVTSTREMPSGELDWYDSDEAAIVLVTCVPLLYYDHRLVVTARLVGVR